MTRTLWLCAAALVACAHAATAQNTSVPTVTLNATGTVVGQTNGLTGLDQFLGIPYARPPVGALRFAAPVPLVANSSRVITATAYGPSCLQVPSVSYF